MPNKSTERTSHCYTYTHKTDGPALSHALPHPAGARHHFQASQRVLSTNSFRVSTMRSHPANTTSPCITITLTCPHICTYTSPLRPLQDSSTPPAVTRQPCSLQYVCHRPHVHLPLSVSICLYATDPMSICANPVLHFINSYLYIYIYVCVYIYIYAHTHTHLFCISSTLFFAVHLTATATKVQRKRK